MIEPNCAIHVIAKRLFIGVKFLRNGWAIRMKKQIKNENWKPML